MKPILDHLGLVTVGSDEAWAVTSPVARPRCTDPQHNPPTMIVLPPGKHEWECPACHHTQVVIVQGHCLTAPGAAS